MKVPQKRGPTLCVECTEAGAKAVRTLPSCCEAGPLALQGNQVALLRETGNICQFIEKVSDKIAGQPSACTHRLSLGGEDEPPFALACWPYVYTNMKTESDAQSNAGDA